MNHQKNNIDASYLNDNLFDHCITLYITNMKYLRDRDDSPWRRWWSASRHESPCLDVIIFRSIPPRTITCNIYG